MIDVKFLVDNIHIVVMGAGIVLTPIGIYVKAKLDNMTNFNDNYFPSVEKYEKIFKEHTVRLNEQVSKPNKNKGGF